jgi:hypothetical protein
MCTMVYAPVTIAVGAGSNVTLSCASGPADAGSQEVDYMASVVSASLGDGGAFRLEVNACSPAMDCVDLRAIEVNEKHMLMPPVGAFVRVRASVERKSGYCAERILLTSAASWGGIRSPDDRRDGHLWLEAGQTATNPLEGSPVVVVSHDVNCAHDCQACGSCGFFIYEFEAAAEKGRSVTVPMGASGDLLLPSPDGGVEQTVRAYNRGSWMTGACAPYDLQFAYSVVAAGQ